MTGRSKAKAGEDHRTPQNLQELLDQLEAAAKGPRVRVSDLHEAIGTRAFGPFLIVPALAAVTPLGVVPLVPSIIAVCIVVVALQLVFGRKDFWLPKIFLDRQIKSERVTKSAKMARPAAKFIDRFIHPRLHLLAGRTAARIVALICVILACAIPPLELVPFGVILPATAVAIFGVGLMAHDGAAVILGAVVSLAGLGLGAAHLVGG